MIRIEITPAIRGRAGSYKATGHAGPMTDTTCAKVCTAVTAIEECLAANLLNMFNIRATRRTEGGRYELRWNKSDKQGRGIRRSNDAAGFAYNGLKALAAAYPDKLQVEWKRQTEERRDNHDNPGRD